MSKRRKQTYYNFVALPKSLFFGRCPEWQKLSGSAKLLYIYLKAGYNGANNGEITFPYSRLRKHRGLSSSGTIAKASKELEEKGFISRTNKGGLYKGCNMYKFIGAMDPLF